VKRVQYEETVKLIFDGKIVQNTYVYVQLKFNYTQSLMYSQCQKIYKDACKLQYNERKNNLLLIIIDVIVRIL